MLSNIIRFSLNHKLVIFLFTAFLIGFGIYSMSQVPIGAVPDVTNNQVQVITTSENLATQDIEQFITYPVELEMANLPGVREIRSVSKFGLSVVTIVFEEDLGTYLPRQLIAEKIKSASEKIPQGFGEPQMGPITTGLGEIYQYTLDTKPGYEDQYNAQVLRTIQDWIVKRQLSGIEGVVEINAWGGYLKQYEVAINSSKLQAMGISVSKVFKALQDNNGVAGGGYIEKLNQAYFIRGQGRVTSLDDIRNIVVQNENGVPVLIKDVADVGFGNATRYGAITGNGKGETVLGQVMMLKGANSNKVIRDVKDRVEEISGTLPDGVVINPFLDRSELISRTTMTITENLILGCLIVIFVVVLLLGNFRSGLVVASVIPLCLLFALSLMYIFGVDANLMSLGAIDFGIIIDGAVIIVEFTAFMMTKNPQELSNPSDADRQELKDEISYKSASRMMNSAIFGQLIILIVFIPILSLSGVEGKMFRPMALTFGFALIGAMLLCLTYVPVVSSLFLKEEKLSDKNISVRLINYLNGVYRPVIQWSLKHGKPVLGIALLLLVISGFIFSRLGGEFIPQLDEGDYVIQPVLRTGTSLGKTIELTTQMETILLDSFPEVEQVVSRIGAAEVPTDPMSMEESDVIVTLKPKKEWVSAETKEELAEKFKEKLSVIPGIELEFTQPIEMRFNELITGVRADIAIKIFGEDLDILNAKAQQIRQLIKDVKGASDITVEKIVGLPQMNVAYDRSKIARYGLNIADLNDMITMGFSGKTMGSVFEGEKRFDLVVRLEESQRQDIENIRNLYVDTPAGQKIPLSELAEITYQKGAAKISRDDTKRRIVVSVNVRESDLQTVVSDIQQLINDEIILPPGYTITYGGQFENLKSATARLQVAVPVALLLIFVLLYFAFSSIREALMIFPAIPLAAVGGILMLWLRGMPFSISAGVGFIALFGIAVLNGIVLIEHFKELQKNGMKFNHQLIITGTQDRLRAVLLTASAAALGFLPMAVSTGAGAEVQRPLASVVIGGLITSTLLTLIVLPVIYSYFHREKSVRRKKMVLPRNFTMLLIFLLCGVTGYSQEKITITDFEQLKALVLSANSGLDAAELRLQEARKIRGSAFTFEKTTLYKSRDNNNLAQGDVLDVFGVQQDLEFPTVYLARRKILDARYGQQEAAFRMQRTRLEQMAASIYYRIQYQHARMKVIRNLDSLYQKFAYAADRRFQLGATNYLEKITARAKQERIGTEFRQARHELEASLLALKPLLSTEVPIMVKDFPLTKLSLQLQPIEDNPGFTFYQKRNEVYRAEAGLEAQQLLPGISFNYFEGNNAALEKPISGYMVGLKIPILFWGNTAGIKSAKLGSAAAKLETIDYENHLNSEYSELNKELQKYEEILLYFENEGNRLSEEIIKTATLSFKNGDIDFFQYIQSLENAYEIVLSYYDNLNLYNQTVIRMNYLIL
ncbi:CusA/CzcA family heavy metal efflux RND transporter [Zeaxanthinibacter enoshimensis]|uniref:Cobalt-zinc-cadmium resistance protein CzcA n=1 Tax=Zeaxanthinibacter enoshimensis TaxID=392009 RepID=A0A4R6TML3_9FLAO|nr:CusA/CzcA family heavy metal efflux RND transporter [Zeaxanthinibacter enoshimensis]TDQ31098.1 cobalt-zinc-cadmium resistance protein CzcA [Zeaxanthinibacter enoshimensis]